MSEEQPQARSSWPLAIFLMSATFVTTCWAGAQMVVESGVSSFSDFLSGWVFAVPLMSILLAHEFGHYIAGRIHGVAISPPYFIPMPPNVVFLGTMGAVIHMPSAIRSRNALLDVGAAGPIAGFVVALPILIFGIATSPVEILPNAAEVDYLMEGRSILYGSLIYVMKGSIAEGKDIMLTPTALAGWAGLLVTMINMIPIGQLDGGHVAYALFGKAQHRISRIILRSLPLLAVIVGLGYGIPSYLAGVRGDTLTSDFLAGAPWMMWAVLLFGMGRMAGEDHPETDGDDTLSPGRKWIALGTLLLFLLLFMPSWMRVQ